jgi:hypothetical protein
MAKTFRTMPLNSGPRTLYSQIEIASKTLDRQVSFGQVGTNGQTDHYNISRWYATGTSPGTANTQFTVSHNLFHIPWHVFWAAEDGSNIYYSHVAGWTAATNSAQGSVFLKSTGISTVYHVIIV